MVQLFLRGAGEKTRSIQVEDLTCNVQTFKTVIEACTGIPTDYQGLVFAGRQLQDESTLSDCSLQPGSTVQLVYRLLGGKGGFGALLRGQGRDGKITDNFDACRDLNGRRVRHQVAQEKLEQWREEGKQRELERVAMQHIKEEAKKAKRAEAEEVDVHAIREAQEEAITRTQAAVKDALAAGLNNKAGKHTKSNAGGSSSADAAGGSGAEAGAGNKRKDLASVAAGTNNSAKSTAPPAKKSKMLAALDDVSSDDSDDDDKE